LPLSPQAQSADKITVQRRMRVSAFFAVFIFHTPE
jgi:hypothetical protein